MSHFLVKGSPGQLRKPWLSLNLIRPANPYSAQRPSLCELASEIGGTQVILKDHQLYRLPGSSQYTQYD
ncbi:hypothetical protein RRG08_002973 [Elysia crispata]|uniref:Uncharacterized protein n=1 Tax=Elysia crispata TaxID=231223 RepID=A0AAE0XR81_9GAST|nr:hypothetical protein RRG08_002973 [Elysia crispata]